MRHRTEAESLFFRFAKDQEAACQEERLLAQALSSYMDAVL
jgi:hypothetical protein